jgi:hypothetical protein
MCASFRARFIAAVGVSLALGLCGKVSADHPVGVFDTTGSGPINSLSANTLERGCWAFGAQTEYVNFKRYSDEQLTEFAAQGFDAENVDFSSVTFVSVGYGLTDDITLVARLPYVQLDDVREPVDQGSVISLEDRGDPSGHGDLLLLSVIEVWQSEADDTQVSAILGIEAPTGRTDSPTLQGETFAFEHQAGSRSWDSLFGAAVSAYRGVWSFHANSTYLWSPEGRPGTDLGDTFNYNAAVVCRLTSKHLYSPCEHCHCEACLHDRLHGCCHEGRSLDLILELNGAWQDTHLIDGQVDQDSGGHLLLVSPGLRLTFHEPWCIYSSCGFPILQDQNGVNREIDFRVVLGVIVNY